MSEHDPLCPCAKWRADLALCACRTIRTIRADQDDRECDHCYNDEAVIRADEREKIARRQEQWARELLANDRYSWPVTAKLLASDLPIIARNGGRDDDA